jgi:hypothetical protein
MCDPLSVLGVPSGPSGPEQAIGAQESTLSRDLMANYQQEYAQQQDTLSQLTSEINQVRSGTTGPGFGAAELAARTSGIISGAAAGERNAEQAAANRAAGQTFGGAGSTSGLRAQGIREQIDAQIMAGGETAKSAALNELTAQNYQQGRINAEQTIGGLSRLAGLESPTQYAQLAGAAGEQAFSEAEKIQQQQEAHEGGIGALLEGGVSALTGGIGNLDLTGGSTFGENVMNFLQGAGA